ncbi:DUF3653 domain-containing protein [Paenibacillus ginsengihumi]|uniref:DUF3653 domain-containing protein n=1 Tax=Paenibacillus ginsengihumi TaxID=431596 RepID=UPI000366EAC3
MQRKLSGVWDGWSLTSDALISPSGRRFTPDDIEPLYYTQADLARALGVSRMAIGDRVRRGTLPPFDKGKTWHRDTIKRLLNP